MSLLLALSAPAAWAQAPAAGLPVNGLTAEERLEAIRLGLVQEALRGATRVESLAWVDGQGVLREGSSFRSGMQVRGVQVLAYARDGNGQPQAQLKLPTIGQKTPQAWTSEAAAAGQDTVQHPPQGKVPVALKPAATKRSPSQAVAAAGCQRSSALKHLLGLQLLVEPGWSSDDAPLAYALSEFAGAAMLQVAGSQANTSATDSASASQSSWRMVLQDAPPRSAYTRVLLGSSHDQLPWQAFIRVMPARHVAPLTQRLPEEPGVAAARWVSALWAQAERPPTAVRIQFSLVATGQSRPFFEAEKDLTLTPQLQASGPPQLSELARDEATALVRQWAQQLSARLVCEPVRTEVSQAMGSDLRLNVGALAGVRVGEEWLLANPQRFPQQILEPGVAAGLVLARVQQVFAHYAQLQVLAGPRDQVRPAWRAWLSESPAMPSESAR